MKKKTVYAVFTLTDSGKDYMVKGNFGNDKAKAEAWKVDNENRFDPSIPEMGYPNGLFVKEVKY